MRTQLPPSSAGREGPTARASSVALLVALTLTTSCSDYRVCPTVEEARVDRVPDRLSATGLFADVKAGTLGPGVRAYRPRFPLWSDGAEKRRWVWLPPGARVDTRAMDAWRFPEGTRLWKEFSRDGVRVETRLLQKVGPADADWVSTAYLWNDEESEAIVAKEGAIDAHGTPHDVPAANVCMGCHGGRVSRVLGFSAIQLSKDAEPGEIGLKELLDEGLLSDPPAGAITVPGNSTEQAALGYIHANCGHCHNQERPPSDGPRCYDPENDLDFWLRVDRLSSVQATPTYETAVGQVVKPGDPAGSKLFKLVSARGEGRQMPPLATERVDDAAVEVLRAWIENIEKP